MYEGDAGPAASQLSSGQSCLIGPKLLKVDDAGCWQVRVQAGEENVGLEQDEAARGWLEGLLPD